MAHTKAYYEKIIVDIDKLLNGIDPQTGIIVEDSIISSSYNQGLLIEIKSLLSDIISGKNLLKKRKKTAFQISDERVESFKCSKTPISISKLSYMINESVDLENTKKLYATQITSWLEKHGYLHSCEDSNDDCVFRQPTEKGELLGLKREKLVNDEGKEYFVNLYDYDAQKFVVCNLKNIIGQN